MPSKAPLVKSTGTALVAAIAACEGAAGTSHCAQSLKAHGNIEGMAVTEAGMSGKSRLPAALTRAESVRAGLEEVGEDAVAIIVHDAARPLVDDAVLERVLGPLAEGWAGVVPGLPVADTVKRVAEDVVTGTVDRADLVTVQTPQAFPAETLRAAYAGDLVGATDCASLVERAGGRIRIVAGDLRLLKVTTSDDLARIESWLP